MDAIVCPDPPIVVGFSLGVLTVLIVQEGDHLVQHRFSNRKARAKGRACKVESEVGTDSVFRNKILEAPSGARIRIIVKTHPFIDLFINRIAHGSRKLLLGQQLTGSDVALEKSLYPGTATQLMLRNQRPTLTPTPCSGSSTSVAAVWHRRSCGNDARSSLQAPLMLMTA